MYSAVTMVIYSQKASLVITVKLPIFFIGPFFLMTKHQSHARYINCKLYPNYTCSLWFDMVLQGGLVI